MNSELVVVSVPYKPFVSVIQKGCILPNVKFLIVDAKTGFVWKTLFRIFLVLRLYSLALMCKMPRKEYLQFLVYSKNSSTRFLFWSPFFLTWWYAMGKLIKSNKKFCFCWGPVNNAANIHRLEYFIQKSKEDKFAFFSMNPYDAEKYEMQLISQVYRRFDSLKENKIESDFYFLGKTKGREKILSQIQKVLEEKKFKIDFRIFPDVPKEPVSFEENVLGASKARCIVDIVSSKYRQNGMTLRPLEALFLGKKLITNYREIVDEDFYHPDNIFVVDEKNFSLEGIEDFMQKPIHKIDEEIVERYEVNHWIQTYFLQGKENAK